MRWHIGTMTFAEADWAGTFYPEGLAQARRLNYYSTQFAAIEVNSTFHAMPAAATLRRWRERVGDGFRFALKAPRAVTHDAPLADGPALMAEFLAAARELGPALGPVLFQFPAEFDVAQSPALAGLLDSLPKDLRFAVEFRSPGWFRRETAAMLRRRNVALVAAELEGCPESAAVVPTADFLYVRLLGRHGRYPDSARERFDPTPRLIDWHRRIAAAADEAGVGECWIFTNNDYAGHAPATARRFAAVAGQDAPPPPVKQRNLFDL